MVSELTLEQISLAELYKNVQKIECVKDPIFHFKELNLVGDLIHKKFDELGLKVSEHKFSLEGFDGAFRNIEANLSHGKGPTIVISSHYDTVPTTPGANDNASAIALQLELAKQLVHYNSNLNVKFVCFTLEELNPVIWKTINTVGKTLDLYDNQNRLKTWHYKNIRSKFNLLSTQFLANGLDHPNAFRKSYEQLHSKMTENERKLYQTILELYPIQENYEMVGHIGLIGSTKWIQHVQESKLEIKYAINFDEIAMTSQHKYSHQFPEGIPIKQLPHYSVNIDERVGNFISMFVDKNSEQMLGPYLEQAESNSLPYIAFPTQMDYNQMRIHMAEALHADHAPFWRANIPCMMVTDWGEYRSPYAHTMADTADRLDYSFLRQIIFTTYKSIHNL